MDRFNKVVTARMNRLSVAQRLSCGFGFLMILVLAMAASGGVALHSISRHMDRIVDVNNFRTGLANDLLTVIDSLAVHSVMVTLVTDRTDMNNELAAFNNAVGQHEKVQQALSKALEQDNPDDPGRKLLAEIQRSGSKTLPGIKEAVKLGYDGSSLQATDKLTKEVHANEVVWRKNVMDLLALQKARTAESVAQARVANAQALTTGALLMLVALVSGTLVALWTVRNNVKMMNVIADQNATLEKRVAERTAQLHQKTNDIAAMLQNMTLGVCTVIPGNRIHPEHSSYLRTITGKHDLADQLLMPAVFGSSDLGADVQDQISVVLESALGEDIMAFEFNQHLLPTEMQLSSLLGEDRSIQMQWSPILGVDNLVEKVLLIVQDVTHLRALELAASKQRQELDTISDVLKVPAGKFNDFIASCRKLAEEGRSLVTSTAIRDDAVIAHLFRNLHTIKGNARTFGFTLITDPAHVAEGTYDLLRKDPAAVWATERLLAELKAVEFGIESYADINDKTLGRAGRASGFVAGRGVFLSLEQLADLQHAAVSLSNQPSSVVELENLQTLVANVGLASMGRIVSGAMDAANVLASEMGKSLPKADIVGSEIGFNPEFAEALKCSLLHIVRNSLDHGIEAPEERVSKGKPAQATLTFHCQRRSGHLEMTIRDDGRGLALQRLAEKASQTGLDVATLTREGLAELIFTPGISTAEELTQVSGRGVGMDAVRKFLEEQGANIRIELDAGSEEQMFAPFAFVVQVPDGACSLAAAALKRVKDHAPVVSRA